MSNKKCNCFSDTLDKMRLHIREQLPEGATEFSVDWKGVAIIFGDDHVPVNPEIAYSYRAKRKNGIPAKNLTRKSFFVLCSYCPFCGRKLGEDEQ